MTNPVILNQRLRAAFSRRWLTLAVTGFSVLGMATALGTAPDTVVYEGPLSESVAAIALPLPEPVLASPERASIGRETRITRGDTAASVFARLGIEDDEALRALRQDRQAALLFRQLVPGKTVAARVLPDGSLQELVFPLNGEKDVALTIIRGEQGITTKLAALATETNVVTKGATIEYSLFGATDAADIPDAVATQLADIFGGEIDFHRDLRKGDRFSVVYETISHQGRPLRTGRILAAEFINAGKRHTAFWYESPEGGGYYDARGQNLRKAFLRSPLEFSRITSGFSSARYHPLLQEVRAHRGIDYAAPTGTRVRATGDGVVEFVGVQGGYGKVVTLRHAGNRLTVYGHLSGFASGLRKGQRVSQGEVIGYVGATGLATGPHLHYEFRVNGVHCNPLTATIPAAPPLASGQLAAFQTLASERARLMAMSEPMSRLAALD